MKERILWSDGGKREKGEEEGEIKTQEPMVAHDYDTANTSSN